MTITATPGIPAANNNPSSDQPIMQTNNDNFIAMWAVDHVGFGSPPSGTHNHVTFPNNQTNPGLAVNQTQLYPKLFGNSTTFLETYTAANMSNSAQINGYLPFVKAMTSVVFPGGAGPNSVSPAANTLAVNVATVVQAGNTVTVTFTTPLAYNTYYVFIDHSINGPSTPISSITITKSTTTVVFTGAFSVAGSRLAFMVI